MVAFYPQTLSDLQGYIGQLVNDPSFTRYTIPVINNYLDLAQMRWNMECKICRMTDYSALIENQYRYPLTGSGQIASLPVIKILRVAIKGVDLVKKSIDYMDLYSANDWTTSIGTPQEWAIDLNSVPPSLILHPTPQAGDATTYTNNVGISGQNPLTLSYITPHQPLVNASDTPFTVNGVQNTLILPYLAGLAIDVAASLLEPDPTQATVLKAKMFRTQANGYMSLVTQLYYDLEADEPFRIQGGRNWKY